MRVTPLFPLTQTYVVMGTHESGAFIHVQMDTQGAVCVCVCVCVSVC